MSVSIILLVHEGQLFLILLQIMQVTYHMIRQGILQTSSTYFESWFHGITKTYLFNWYFVRNFVVQHVLGLNNATITRRICYSLKGHYVELALLKCGSHVVEKCSTSSRLGLSLVVEAMLENDKTLFLLSWAKFGNYAVQKALNLTKVILFHQLHN